MTASFPALTWPTLFGFAGPGSREGEARSAHIPTQSRRALKGPIILLWSSENSCADLLKINFGRPPASQSLGCRHHSPPVLPPMPPTCKTSGRF